MTVTGGLCLHFTLITPQSPTTLQTGHYHWDWVPLAPVSQRGEIWEILSPTHKTIHNTSHPYKYFYNSQVLLCECEEVNCIGLLGFQYINMSNLTTTHFKCPHLQTWLSLNIPLSPRERFLIMSDSQTVREWTEHHLYSTTKLDHEASSFWNIFKLSIPCRAVCCVIWNYRYVSFQW